MFKPENFLKVPIVKMELTFDDQKMQFYPSYDTIQDLLSSIVDKIKVSLQGVQTVRGFLNGENEFVDTTVAQHYVDDAVNRLKKSYEFYMIQPKEHLKSYSIF